MPPPPKLPQPSHLQIAVLGILSGGECKGAAIRAELAALSVRHSGPAFYQMMARLEDAGLAEGWYDQRVVAGQMLKERRYRITPAGKRALRAAEEFYGRLFRARREAHA